MAACRFRANNGSDAPRAEASAVEQRQADRGKAALVEASLCSSSHHSASPAIRSPSNTLCILLLNAAVPIDGSKVFKVVFGHSLR
jgi:hypothetical protein